MENDWPLIELPKIQTGILAKFTPSAGEAVANILVRELAGQIERPSSAAANLYSNNNEMEWIMQVINHGLTLSFASNESYETLRSAVRIYCNYLSALTDNPHHCCPMQLIEHPDKYFRRILEAFRPIFDNGKCSAQFNDDIMLQLSRQATQIRTILTTTRQLSLSVLEEFKDEVWSRTLLFLITVTEQILSIGNCKSQDSIGFLMASDLSESLFGCLTGAALNELIPSPSYWKTLSSISIQSGHQVQFVECWAKTLLNSTLIILHNLYGQPLYNITSISDENQIFEPYLSNPLSQEKMRMFKDLWHNLFILFGNPWEFGKNGISQCETSINEQYNVKFFTEQLALSFFLIILAFKKMIDLFIGDLITIGFNESEELNFQWLDNMAKKTIQTMGGQESGFPPNNEGNNSNSNLSIRNQQRTNSDISTKLPPISDKNEEIGQNLKEDLVVEIGNRIRGGQHVWYILKSNPFKRPQPICASIRPSATSLLSVFLDFLYESTLLNGIVDGNGKSTKKEVRNGSQLIAEDGLSQKSTTESGSSSFAAAGPHHPQSRLEGPSSAASSTSLTTSTGGDGTKMPSIRQKRQEESNNHIAEQQQRQRKFVLRRSFTASISGSSVSNHESTTTTAPIMIAAGSDSTQSGQPQQFASPSEFPAVDGFSSGRATAIGALCRIVCSKASRENFVDEQIARFFAILHEALISRDRLVLCSLLFYSADNLFKLAIKGVQILLPNYLMAIDIVLTESIKIPLHPSISQVEMRATCLRALASILAWPSVFGTTHILGQKSPLGKSKQISRQGSSNNLLEPELRYIDLCPRIQKMLVFSLRNESDAMNIQFCLAISSAFCLESAKYALKVGSEKGTAQNKKESTEAEFEKQTKTPISLIRAVISAVCDNLCKPCWAKETLCCLAAFDCLNSLSTISHQILFHNGELSTGSLVVTSLCRFIDQQLQKPPPHHSRDMHSTVVAAYFCIQQWLTAAPALSNIESCLATVANTIELGMTGGRDLQPEQYKPASQRVHDAAQALLHSLFSSSNPTKQTNGGTLNEFVLTQKFGLQLDKFQHFLLNQSTLLSLHEAQHISQLSKGLPTVICIFRTPFYEPWASLIQLMPKATPRKPMALNNKEEQKNEKNQTASEIDSPSCHSITSQEEIDENKCRVKLPMPTNGNGNNQLTNGGTIVPVPGFKQQFMIPADVLRPQCQLDKSFPKLEPIPPDVLDIQTQLAQIRARLAQGSGAPCGDRDSRNVWLNSSLGAILSKPPTPDSPVQNCNSLRVFLHDMGLLNRQTFGKEFIPLDSSSFDIFYDSLSVTVDKFPTRLNEVVSLFFVKEGQRTAEDILQNNINLKQTSANFCQLLCSLGKAVGTKRIMEHSNTSPSLQQTAGNGNNGADSQNFFVLDGVDYFLRWRDPQTEIAFITPTGRLLPMEATIMSTAPLYRQTSLLLNSRKNTLLPPMEINQQNQQQIRNKSNGDGVFVKTANEFVCINNNKTISIEKEKFASGEESVEQHKQALMPATARRSTMSVLQDLNRKRALLIWAQSIDEISEMGEELHNKTQQKEQKFLNQLAIGVCEERNEDVSAHAEILTIPSENREGAEIPSTLASLSLMTATNVVVKSARFSPHRKQQQQLASINIPPLGYGIELAGEKCQESEIGGEMSATTSPEPKSGEEHPLQQQRRNSSRLELPRTANEQTEQQISAAASLILSPPISPGVRTRRRSSIFKDFLNVAGGEKSRKGSRDGFADLSIGERKESLALSETSQTSAASSSKGAKGQLQHTNSVTTISYLKSFFRRASKATTPTPTTTPLETPKAERRKSRVAIVGEEIEEAESSVESDAQCFSPRESFASSTGRPQLNTDSNEERSPPLSAGDDFDQYQTIKSSRTMSCASANSNTAAEHSAPKYTKRSMDLRILVIWLERLEDMEQFPLAEMLPFTSGFAKKRTSDCQQPQKSPLPFQTDHITFFLFPFERGLVRVQVEGVWTKYGQPGPLLDGTVVSMDVLADLLKQTICNISRRKAVEIENYQMTHLRRKQALAEFGRRFASRQNYTEFVEQLLSLNPIA